MRGESISLRGATVRLDGFEVLRDVSLEVAAGEFLCLLGPSGCGKSTLLNVLAGFVPAAGGEVRVGGQPVMGPDVSRGIVFQSSEALFPWLSVADNIAFGPRVRGLSRQRTRELVRRYVELVGLDHAVDRFPPALSGGMRQRVQIARVLANEPNIVLMDEPFGALDAQTRELLQQEFDRIWQETRPTVVFVTHDIWEAITLGDRIATMTAGPGARIKSIFEVDLARPRSIENQRALHLHERIRTDIADEVRRSLQQEVRA
ncbi:MAG TPA: ABC transporter ATP-binding protein [Candidatus Dormibacteraeota bacterium]|nr:ABC transporter ATP-binding protein [Candidatus Dormibacteraeota bacterium]